MPDRTLAPSFAPAEGAKPLRLVDPAALDAHPDAAWAKAVGFKAGAGEVALVPGGDGVGHALLGRGKPEKRARERFLLAKAVGKLPEGAWRLEGDLPERELNEAALGWLLEAYRFARYKDATPPKARLAAPEGVDARRLEVLAAAEFLARDLINTPASDMGPAELEAAAREVAEAGGATVSVITGDDLLAQNFPMIHAVGRAAAAHRAPRLIDMAWGAEGPQLTLVGKGVCFDTGGLDIKPAASMLTMKKDMGGAATVLGLAQAIMALTLPIRLRVLIPAVENAVGSDAFRPGDILRSRKGLTVEINNTDAEGRLILADALALAAEGEPGLTVSYATLTGAARVAMGADLQPFFTDDEALAAALMQGAADWADPVWRLPFFDPYEALIEPGPADLDNAPSGGMAGAITAALFLRRFAPPRYCHFDVFAWSNGNGPARQKGGLWQGARALLATLPDAL